MVFYYCMKLTSEKIKRNSAMLFVASLLFVVGHVFLLNPQTAQAADSNPSSHTVAHHDTAQHDTEKHSPCPAELHDLSYTRAQELSADIGDLALHYAYFEIFDLVYRPFVSVKIISHEHLPVRLPLAQKTHLLI